MISGNKKLTKTSFFLHHSVTNLGLICNREKDVNF